MEKLYELFEDSKSCIEHPIYHPEGTLNYHILLVALRCLLGTNNMDLVLAAFLHDLFKSQEGEWKETEKGRYWSNKFHAKQAADFILDSDDIRYFIRDMKGNINTVEKICRYHMASKERIPKRAKSTPYIDQFLVMDDMVFRKQFPLTFGEFNLIGDKRKGTLSFVGQSVIQQEAKKGNFTITLNGYPFCFHLSQSQEFFTGKFEPFQDWVKQLIVL